MRKRAFTVIEVMVVIAIIAILAAMFIPVLKAAQKKAAEHQAKQTTPQVEAVPARFILVGKMQSISPYINVGLLKDSVTGQEYIIAEEEFHSVSLTAVAPK